MEISLKVTNIQSLTKIFGQFWDLSVCRSSRHKNEQWPRMTHEFDTRVWPTRMTHKNDPRKWPTRMTYENNPRVWPTRMTHQNDLREWLTSLTHENDPSTRMTHEFDSREWPTRPTWPTRFSKLRETYPWFHATLTKTNQFENIFTYQKLL